MLHLVNRNYLSLYVDFMVVDNNDLYLIFIYVFVWEWLNYDHTCEGIFHLFEN